MRDKIKDEDYFQRYIESDKASYKRRMNKFQEGKIKTDRIQTVKLSMVSRLIESMKARYSIGMPLNQLIEDYKTATNLISESWAGFYKFKFQDEVLDQYSLHSYDEMLWMLSIGYLLDVPMDLFSKLVGVIDKDQVKDKLFEFIISAKIPDRPKIEQESYKYGFKLFGKLRKAIETEEKAIAESLIKEFLEKDWYKEHKDVGWYNNHKSKHDIYSGYWCFESAAVTCIKGLDDSSYRENEYYPKDLVDYYRGNKNV